MGGIIIFIVCYFLSDSGSHRSCPLMSVVPHPAEWAHPSPLVQPGHLLPPTALPQATQVLILLEDSTIPYYQLDQNSLEIRPDQNK